MDTNYRDKAYKAESQPGPAGKGLRWGFNLVELLVVIGIIALLLGILMPSLGKAKSRAMRLKCEYNLKQISLAVNLYMDGNDDTYPCAEDPVSTLVAADPNDYYWLWMGRGWRSFLEPYLGDNIGADNPSVLLCPEDHTSPEMYEGTSYGYSMAFYHSSEQIDAMSSPADTYSNPQPSEPQRSSDVAKPAGKILIAEWYSNHSRVEGDSGWWTWEGRRNYLFADGQVRFLRARHIRPARDGFPDVNLTVHGIKGIDWPP